MLFCLLLLSGGLSVVLLLWVCLECGLIRIYHFIYLNIYFFK